MEEQTTNVTTEQSKSYTLNFFGKGSEYFSIIIVNWLLTLITLGIYYPWARARKIKYMYGATALNDDRFAFNGTGREMFRGFIKVILFYIVIIGILAVSRFISMQQGNLTIYYIGFAAFMLIFYSVLPLIIHGAYRYRMSRTTWRGIRFGYRGTKKELYGKMFKWIGLTIITFGIYSAWFEINLRKYLVGNIRTGDVKYRYIGEGIDLFFMNLKFGILFLISYSILFAGTYSHSAFVTIIGSFLFLFTIIYYFWYENNLWHYYIDNILLDKDGKEMRLSTTTTGGGILKLRFVNFLMIVFSLGLAFAWVECRTRKYFTEHTHLEGDINLDNINQTGDIYTDATGEDATDFFDIDMF